MAPSHGTDGESLTQALLDDSDFLRRIVERTLQQVLEAEMTTHVGAERYERTESRTGHRNGYRPRTMHTRVGTLTLLVPQDREGTFSTALFARYQRSEKALVTALMEMYLEGVSTRKVREVTEALCGTSFSKSLVSSLTSKLDAELAAWRTRPLDETAYPYLFVDARYEDVRSDGRVMSQGVLIIGGVREDGKREVLAVDVADTESEATYQEQFRQLKARGLSGVELVTSDEHRGLVAAIKWHFQGASHQRCQVHFTRDLMGWSERAGEESWPPGCGSCSPRRPWSMLAAWQQSWLSSGGRRTHGSPSSSASTSRSALPATPSHPPIASASAAPMAGSG